MFNMKFYGEKLANIKTNECLLCQNISDEVIIGTNEKAEFNNPKKYKAIDGHHSGGIVVMFPGDVICNWVSEVSLIEPIKDMVCCYLMNKGLPLNFDSNDIMINGKKLFGTMSTPYNGNYYEGMFLSFNPDKDLIDKICKKEMKKVPIGLSSYNISPEEMITLCRDLIKRYGLKEVE